MLPAASRFLAGSYSICFYLRAGGRVRVLAQGYQQGRVDRTFSSREAADRFADAFVAGER